MGNGNFDWNLRWIKKCLQNNMLANFIKKETEVRLFEMDVKFCLSLLTSENNSWNLNLDCKQIISEGCGFESCPIQNFFLFNFLWQWFNTFFETFNNTRLDKWINLGYIWHISVLKNTWCPQDSNPWPPKFYIFEL